MYQLWKILSIVGLSITLIMLAIVTYGDYRGKQRAAELAKKQELKRDKAR